MECIACDDVEFITLPVVVASVRLTTIILRPSIPQRVDNDEMGDK